MTKAEFIDAVKATRGVDLTRKQTEACVNAVFDVLAAALRKHKKFTFPGLGRFQVHSHRAHIGRDPRTQDKIHVKASKSVSFRAAPRLRNSL